MSLLATAFQQRYPELRLVTEVLSDKPFLQSLFMANSTLRDTLPPIMLEQQAIFQDKDYSDKFPDALRLIIWRDTTAIGRLIIDWDYDGFSHCVDIAICPEAKGCGIGGALLSSWITVAEMLGSDCRLEVMPDNRAKNLYSRLGFVGVDDPAQIGITMIRRIATRNG